MLFATAKKLSMPSSFPRPSRNRTFATTRWSMVHAVGGSDVKDSQRALEELCELYWYPLYAFLRRRGHDSHAARDATQGFIMSLLEKGSITKADREKGRFRSFLLGSLNNYLSNQHRHDNAIKRGGGAKVFSIDADDAEKRYGREPVDVNTAERIFERRWALTILDTVWQRLRDTYHTEDRGELFDAISGHVGQVNTSVPYSKIAEKLNTTEGAIKVAAHRLRRRYREMLRAEVAQTLTSTDDIDDELTLLFKAVR